MLMKSYHHLRHENAYSLLWRWSVNHGLHSTLV